MKIKYGLPLLLLLLLCSCEEEELRPEIQKIKMESAFGSAFELQIALPKNYNTSETYGLIFLLDAEWLMKETLAELQKTAFASEYIVVGLAYSGINNRANDFTPTTTAPGSGKASDLASFIEIKIFEEYLTRHYPNLSSDKQKRIFIGHSLGGLFGTYLFLKQTPLFGQYLLISSAYMTDAQSIFEIELQERSAASLQQARMYFATGSLEEGGFHTTVQHFTQVLSAHYNQVAFKSDVVRNAGHVGVRVKALELGLSYLLL